MSVFYFLIFILLIQAAIFGHSNRSNRFLCILAFIELTIVAGLKVPFGGDSYYYRDTFVEISKMSLYGIFDTELEKGFVLFNYLVSLISDNPQSIILFSQILINGLVCLFIYKKSKMPWLSIILYVTFMFYFNSMNLMRFAIACTLLLFSCDHIINRNILKFLAILLLAASFHFSVLIFGIMYYVYPISLKWRMLAMVAVPFMILQSYFFSAFELLILVNERYVSYSQAGEFYQSAIANILEFAKILVIFFFSAFCYNWKIKTIEGGDKLYLWMIYIATIFAYMSINVMMLVRFVVIFSLVTIVFIPNVIFGKPKQFKVISITTLLTISILQVVVILTYRSEWFFEGPYVNILF